MHVRLLSGLRLAFAALAAYTLGYACNSASTPPHGVGTVNFFSYFTILSNIAGVIVLAVGGLAGLAGRRGVPDRVRGAVCAYLVVTGLVYALVLAPDQVGHLPFWIDDVVHQITPIVVFVDWLADPPRTRVPYSVVPYWLLFPVAFVAYSLIRGPIVDWYPYPFLDPRGHGYGRVIAECSAIAVSIVVICLLVVWLGNAVSRMLGRSPSAATDA
jgi:hypothetical protein